MADKPHECQRPKCGYTWVSKIPGYQPKKCPCCQNPLRFGGKVGRPKKTVAR